MFVHTGCSLGTLSRSQVAYSPSTPEAEDLASWWQANGPTAVLVPISEVPSRSPG